MIIGIDPGKNTGIAILENGKLKELKTTNFFGCLDIIKSTDCKYIVEKPNSKYVFAGHRALDVGSVLRETDLIIEYLKMNNRDYETKPPKHKPKKKGKSESGKINHDDFVKLTGWAGKRTNQHVRDAAMLLITEHSHPKI